EFEGFISYGSPIQSPSTNALGQTITGLTSHSVINQPIVSVRKVVTSVSVFDGQSVVLGGLIREEMKSVADETGDSAASNLQKLIKERELLKQRLLEVDELIQKSSKE
ncbi:MAG: hypothetical protein EOP84_13410, partial [Verrucomicrobiaceae bacterium]